jgi:hypothetical protein
MIPLEEFKEMNKEDIQDETEEEIEAMHRIANIFSEKAMESWLDSRLNDSNKEPLMVKYRQDAGKNLRGRICES